jgi:hypothetical protein
MLIIVLSTIDGLAQTTSKAKMIMEVIKSSRATEQAKAMVASLVEIYSKKYPSVSQTVWTEVKAGIDYSKYEKKQFDVYNQNLDEKGVKDLLSQYKTAKDASSIHMPEKLKSELYNAGRDFGKSLNLVIHSKIPK